jgi:uncharacterized protein (DUF1697 family)
MTDGERYIALLRGINVGRAKRVAMGDLRELVTALGFADVRTLLNSGNVVFSGRRTRPDRIATAIEKAIVERLRVSTRVTVLTGGVLERVISENPLREIAGKPANAPRFMVAFLRDPLAARAKLAPLTAQDWGADALALGSSAAYLWCSGGILESRLLEAVGRLLGDEVTTRNWATVTKVQAIL